MGRRIRLKNSVKKPQHLTCVHCHGICFSSKGEFCSLCGYELGSLFQCLGGNEKEEGLVNFVFILSRYQG